MEEKKEIIKLLEEIKTWNIKMFVSNKSPLMPEELRKRLESFLTTK